MKTMSPMSYRAVLRFKDSTGEEILTECGSRGGLSTALGYWS